MTTNLLIFEDGGWRQLLPLTWLRAAFELRCGMDRLLDKIVTHISPLVFEIAVRPELDEVVRGRVRLTPPDPAGAFTLVNSRVLVTQSLAPPSTGTAWISRDAVLAATFASREEAERALPALQDQQRCRQWIEKAHVEPTPAFARLLQYPWEPALLNRDELLRQCRVTAFDGKVHASVHVVEPQQAHVSAGAIIRAGVVLDSEAGPVYIDADAIIEPNAVLIGPCYVGPHAIIRSQATIREGVSIGPYCRVGGEVSATILHGYANKQHEGFLGHSYVGEWVNLGAGTITSNLKNTYGRIRVMLNGHAVDSGEQFIGTMFGDHAKTGIGTILPTGCILGCNANVFTREPVPKFVPSFAWLTDDGMTRFEPDKAVGVARTVMSRRRVELGPAQERVMRETSESALAVESGGWTIALPRSE